MIVWPEQWNDLYDGVREDKHNSTEKKISVFVNAADCDSVCALKILQAILIHSSITYTCHVVSTQRELQLNLIDEVGHNGQDLRTVFCINCGGTLPVTELLAPLSEAARASLRLVIIDSHRPIHHSLNDPDDSSAVILLDPEFDVHPDDIPLAEAVIDSQAASEGPLRRRRLDENGGSQPSASTSDGRAEWDAECAEYYARGSLYGVPASMILFRLAHKLNMSVPFLLWMAILGVTEQAILRRVLETTPHHVQSMRDLGTYVAELDLADRQQNLCGEGYESDDDVDDALARRAPADSRKAPQGVIKPSLEYKFLLHRHWSLLDSLTHSPLLAARLRTFKEGGGGRGSLEVLLARAGIPMAQAQLKFAQMKVQYKEAMLPQIAEHIRLNSQKDGVELSYDSFTLEYTNRLTLSAADHVHAICAHLEHAHGQRSCTDFKGGFWSAYKATDVSVESGKLLDGIALSMSLHRKLLEDVNAVHQNGYVCQEGEFDVLDLSDHEAWASSSPLVHPLAITRLACLVKDVWTYQMHGRLGTWKSRPLVIIGAPDDGGMCLVGAVPGMKALRKHPITKDPLPSSHDGALNVFGGLGGLFQASIDDSGIHSARHDLADSALLQLHKTDAAIFVNHLALMYAERDKAVWQKEAIIRVQL